MTAIQSALLERHSLRAGKIFTAVAIFGLCVLAGVIMLPAFQIVFFLICSLITIGLFCLTFGAVMYSEVYRKFVSGWFSFFIGGTDVTEVIINALPTYAPILCGLSIAACVLACACFAFSIKRRSSRVWIVVCVVCLIVTVIFTVRIATGNIISIGGGSV